MNRRLFTFVFSLTIFGLLWATPLVSAHPGGWAPFFAIDGQYPNQYFILSNKYGDGTDDNRLPMPQSEMTRTFQVNETIDFNIDTKLLTISPDTGPVTFSINTGDGNTYHTTHITHAFARPGSYIVSVNASATIQGVSGDIEAVLINVVPYEGYQLPKAAIIAEGKSLKDDASLFYSSNQLIHFDAHDSVAGSGRLTKYTWTFGDTQKTDAFATSHIYDPSFEYSMVILRVTDQNGLWNDAYIFVENQHPSKTSASQPSTTAPSTHNKLSFGQHFSKWYLDISGWLRNTLARFGGVGPPIPAYFIALLLLIAMVLGALHALTPGHSKSLMAALLIGKRKAKTKDVVILSSAITLTHTAVIYVLGIIFLVLDTNLSLGRLIPVFERVSAVAVILLGGYLVSKGLRPLIAARWHRHQHAHDHEHSHEHTHDYQIKGESTRELFVAGASGGLIPCVDALSLLIVAASVHAVALGLLIVVFFSLGLALSIVAIGLAIIHTKKIFKLEDKIGAKVAVLAPLVSGVFIVLLGLALLLGHQI